MSKTPPPPADGTADIIARAAADLMAAASELRDETAALRLERRAHAELIAERDRLIEENREHQKAILLLLDQLFQTAGPQHAEHGKETTHA